MQYLQRPEEGVESSGNGVIERMGGGWESNLGLLQEQPGLLTAELFLKPNWFLRSSHVFQADLELSMWPEMALTS